jgi:hypothetical protein
MRRRTGEKFETIIDLEDLDKVDQYDGKFYPHFSTTAKRFYADMSIKVKNEDGSYKKTTVRMHRIILDCWKSRTEVDHIDGNTLDNRKHNLRKAKIKDNLKNRHSFNINNNTGQRNVCLHNGQYLVQIQVNGKNKCLGSFDNIEDAGAYAEEMRQLHYKEFAGTT